MPSFTYSKVGILEILLSLIAHARIIELALKKNNLNIEINLKYKTELFSTISTINNKKNSISSTGLFESPQTEYRWKTIKIIRLFLS